MESVHHAWLRDVMPAHPAVGRMKEARIPRRRARHGIKSVHLGDLLRLILLLRLQGLQEMFVDQVLLLQ